MTIKIKDIMIRVKNKKDDSEGYINLSDLIDTGIEEYIQSKGGIDDE